MTGLIALIFQGANGWLVCRDCVVDSELVMLAEALKVTNLWDLYAGGER